MSRQYPQTTNSPNGENVSKMPNNTGTPTTRPNSPVKSIVDLPKKQNKVMNNLKAFFEKNGIAPTTNLVVMNPQKFNAHLNQLNNNKKKNNTIKNSNNKIIKNGNNKTRKNRKNRKSRKNNNRRS
jgi:hypothetical protein